MNKELINKVKLREDECIVWETMLENLMVCEKMDEFGIRYMHSQIFTDMTRNRLCIGYDFLCHDAEQDAKPITATEWLNRHGVFVPGQEVECSDCQGRHVYVGSHNENMCVFCERCNEISKAKFVASPFQPWRPIKEEPTININGKDFTKDELMDKMDKAFGGDK